MYFKKNWGSVVEKGPPLGHIDIFQTSPRPSASYGSAGGQYEKISHHFL